MAGLRIDRLALQVAELSESEAHSLAMQLADRLAQSPMRGSSRRIDAMQVTVTLSESRPRSQLGNRIADELLRRIAREGG